MKLKLKTEVILIYFSPRYCNFRQWPLILRGQNVTYSAMFKVGVSWPTLNTALYVTD